MPLRHALVNSLVLAPVVHDEIWHHTRPHIVASAEWLVVHLRWLDRYREVVLV